MPTKINWTIGAQVAGGPQFALSGSQDVEAYEVIDVSVAPGTTLKVSVQPASGKLTFLLIQSDTYHDTNLTYRVNEESETSDGSDGDGSDGDDANNETPVSYNLQAPHMLIGTGATMLLDSSIETITFTNDLTAPVGIKILAGRDATP